MRTQVERTGTKVMERVYEATIEKPTARESGTNSARPTPTIKSEGRKTASTHNMASSWGTAVSRLASSTALASGFPEARCVWMFSMATVAWSTRIPTASASPPRVIRMTV